MSGFFKYDGPMMQFLSKIFDLMLLGVLWLAGCLPIITVGASTTAMYTVLFKLAKGEDYTVWRLFWRAFQDNFKQAMAIWLMCLAALVLFAADLFAVWLLSDNWVWTIVLILLLILAVLILCALIFVFPLQAYYENTVGNTLKNALLFSLTYFPKAIWLLVVDVAVWGIAVFMVQPLLLFAGVLMGWANVTVLNGIFARHIKRSENEGDMS